MLYIRVHIKLVKQYYYIITLSVKNIGRVIT